MRLSDKDIITALNAGKIGIEPRPDDSVITGVSVDLRLGNSFRVFKDHARPFVDVSASREEINSTLEALLEVVTGVSPTVVVNLSPMDAMIVFSSSLSLVPHLISSTNTSAMISDLLFFNLSRQGSSSKHTKPYGMSSFDSVSIQAAGALQRPYRNLRSLHISPGLPHPGGGLTKIFLFPVREFRKACAQSVDHMVNPI